MICGPPDVCCRSCGFAGNLCGSGQPETAAGEVEKPGGGVAATLDVRHARYVGLQVGVTGLPTQNSEGPPYGPRIVSKRTLVAANAFVCTAGRWGCRCAAVAGHEFSAINIRAKANATSSLRSATSWISMRTSGESWSDANRASSDSRPCCAACPGAGSAWVRPRSPGRERARGGGDRRLRCPQRDSDQRCRPRWSHGVGAYANVLTGSQESDGES